MIKARIGTYIAAVAATLAAAPAVAQPVAAPPRPERDADYHNRQMAYLYALSPAQGWMTTPSGLRYRKLSGTATGPAPSPNDTVTIHYVGRFIDGSEFDSSVARGEPATFPLPRLIRGWQEGVPFMHVGERFEFAIPGGATLLFTIDLIAVPAGQ